MVAHALATAGGSSDVNAMIKALEGWTFLAPKGTQTIRAADHAMLQPMFQVRLKKDGTSFVPVVLQHAQREPDGAPGGGQLRQLGLFRCRPPARTSPQSDCREIGFRVGGFDILRDIDLEVRDGELLGIIGPNGAGKTTLFNLLTGLLRPTTGTIELYGRDLARSGPVERARLGVGRTFQTSSLFDALSVLENARITAHAAGAGPKRWWRRPRLDDTASEVAMAALAVGGARRRWPAGSRAASPTATSASSSWRSCSPAVRVSCCSTSRWRG